MKITVDIDCTSEEARNFLGLPDVKPMQEALMVEVEKRMRTNMEQMDPETMMRTWLPMGMQGLDQVQKMFWNQMASPAGGANPESE